MKSDPPLRLTRRGKAVLWCLCLSLVLPVLAAGAGWAAPAPPGAAPRPGERVVVVRPGDTLWSITAEHAPSLDPYGIIEEIRRRNGLSEHTIHAGQELIVP